MKTCYIIGAGECGKIEIKKGADDIVICADGGLAYAEKYGVKPDLTLGDFDSFGRIPYMENIIVHPTEKDETDTHLAVKCALEKGYKNFVMYAMLGGRLDHTYANTQILSYLSEKDAKAVLIGKDCNVTMVKNGKIEFSKDEKGTISVFSFSPESRGVTIKGLKYEAENITVSSSYPIGVSNEFIGKDAFVSVDDGKLLIIQNSLFY